MEWKKIESDDEVYQSEKGDIIIVLPVKDNEDFEYEIKAIPSGSIKEIRVETTKRFKEKMLEALKSDMEQESGSFLDIFF